MTPPVPATLVLQSATRRKWSLTTIRPLSPSVSLVRTPSSKYALKTLTLHSDELISAAVADADVWRRACTADSTNIVILHDVVVDPPRVYYIMEYCPGGDLSAIRNEPSALRCIAAVAAGLEVVLSRCQQPAHANLSTKHVLLDASGTPKLSGWGIVRAKRLSNPKRTLTERDDVRALAAILYEMLYGKRFDVDNLKLPDTPRVSRLTADLLRNVLYVRLKDVPELTVFRYDVVAARRLVPACTSALKPIHSRRREEILDIDLNSKRGLDTPPRPEVEKDDRRDLPQRAAPPSEEPRQQPNVVQGPAQTGKLPASQARGDVQAPTGIDVSSDSGIDDSIRRITKGDTESISTEQVDYLIESCSQVEELPDKIFKVLFRLPISKNPIVAFKAITVVHRLIAEGPANLTALAITNDGFLSWIESSWSRDRMQNKSGKIHMYSYCFAAGEVSWYTTILRKRIEVHGRFAQVLSTHWVPRPDGLPSITTTRRDAFTQILGVVEKGSSLLRKVITAKDPAAQVKQSAVPVLVNDVWRAYHAICWMYATAEDSLKPNLHPELELAHSAAKSAIDAVKLVPNIAERCPPHMVLDFPHQVPREFDTASLVKTLRKKKRRKKKKTVSSDSNGETGPDARDEEKQEQTEREAEKVKHDEEDSTEPAHEESKQRRPKGRREKDKQRLEKDKQRLEKGKERLDEDRDLTSESSRPKENVEYEAPPQRAAISQSGRPRTEPSGLQKLSLSVRRGVHRGPPERSTASRAARNSSDEETGPDLSKISYKSASARLRTRPRPKLRHSDGDEESSDSSDETNTRAKVPNGSAHVARDAKERRNCAKQKKKEEPASESESEEESPVRSKSDAKKKKKKKKRHGKKSGSSEGSSSSEEEGGLGEPKRAYKKVPRLKHVDEKSIPFDKEHPTRRRAAKKKTEEDEYKGGSKEALAAAAKGKKTPSMNPKFEVAPYEVNFGPQIGSGGFGVVYKAKFRNETVAVKKIHAHALTNPASVAEFQAEVAVLCTLSHPNILRFVGACTKPPHLMIITEFMARGTLFDLLHQTNTRVTWPMRRKIALDTCKGMRYLHDSKLLHRDLKSSNLMLDKDYNCKVGDFGLTRISRGSSAVQMTGQCGTFQYMAVEVLANKPYSEKADVFSFGILLWEMVARKLPYFGMQPMQVGIAVLQQGLRPTIPPKCPEPLAKLMRACWDSDPSRRPSFAQLIQALEAMPE